MIARSMPFALAFLTGAPAQDPTASFDLAAELARAVDLPTPDERQRAADALARRSDVALDAWRDAMAAFAPRSGTAPEPGVHRIVAPLWNGTAHEDTELWLFVPETHAQQRPAPLLLMAHGTGGSGEGQHAMWRTTAESLGMIVVSPSDPGAGQGYAYSPRERELLLAALREARRRFDIDEDRVFLAGISRGGHLTWDVALRHPDNFAAIAPMIGGPRLVVDGGQNNLRYLENVRHLPIRDLQGALDDPLLLFNLRLAFEKLAALGARDAKLLEFERLGHSFDPGAVDWPAWFGAARRDPAPESVVRVAARKGESRAFWLEILRTSREVQDEFRPRVSADLWNSLDDHGRRRLVAEQAEERSARATATRTGPGTFAIESRGVTQLRLLLTEAQLGDARQVTVTWNGKVRKASANRPRQVLLREFVERFDRRFLPVVAVELR